MAPSDVTKFLTPTLENSLAAFSTTRRQPSAPSPPPSSSSTSSSLLLRKLSLNRRKRPASEPFSTFESSFDAEVKRARLQSHSPPIVLAPNVEPQFSVDESRTLFSAAAMNGHKSLESRFGSSSSGLVSTKTPKSPPVASLCNLGNTCFLNSVLYTLRFTPGFLHSLHHMVHDLGLNGNGGKSNKRTNGVAALQIQSNGSANSISDAETELVHDVIDQVKTFFIN